MKIVLEAVWYSHYISTWSQNPTQNIAVVLAVRQNAHFCLAASLWIIVKRNIYLLQNFPQMPISRSFVSLFITQMPETEFLIAFDVIVFNIRTQSPTQAATIFILCITFKQITNGMILWGKYNKPLKYMNTYLVRIL